MKAINIGCGKDIKKGWTNLDIVKREGVDIIFDLEKLPKQKILVRDNSFDLVYCKDVLEHFYNPIPILKELSRICKIGGTIEIKVPYGDMVFINLDHKRMFLLSTFNTKEGVTEDSHKGNVKLIYRRLYTIKQDRNTFLGLIKRFVYGSFLFVMNYLIKISPTIYDGTFLRYIFPQTNIHIKYEKI